MTLKAEERLRGLWAADEINLIPIESKSYFQDDVGATIVQLRALNEDCTHVFWTLDGADIRVTFTEDRDPVAGTAGHLFVNGSTGVWPREMAEAARMVRNAGVNALFCVTQLSRMA